MTTFNFYMPGLHPDYPQAKANTLARALTKAAIALCEAANALHAEGAPLASQLCLEAAVEAEAALQQVRS